jgi:predicted nucleotide-binding protein
MEDPFMPEERELVPLEGELLPAGAIANAGLEQVSNDMLESLQQALAGFQFQDVPAVDRAARTAAALYDASERNASPDELLLLEVLKNIVVLFAPFTRAVVFQVEGRFPRALAELAKALQVCHDVNTAMDNYAGLFNADEEVIAAVKPIVSTFPILIRGIDANVRAEMVAYQGNIHQYRQLLREAVAELRQAEQLPASVNPVFQALAGLCTGIAERLETRIEVFSSDQEQRYLIPTGDKIFIIHGHDEGKWRELRDLLEDSLGQKTTVLMEEPGASGTVIKKFEEFASDCCYAFALLTPDDFVEKGDKTYFQARPNVVFEMGWFCGRFGRDRVSIIKKDTTMMPSDLGGLLTIDFHANVSEGFVKIQSELQRAGIVPEATRQPTRGFRER